MEERLASGLSVRRWDPAFAELLDDPAFKAQLTRMTVLVNIERAKLGMAPLP